MATVGTIRGTLSNRGLARALGVYTLGSASVGIAAVVIAVELFRRSESASWASVGVGMRVLPFVFFSSLAGVVADTMNPRALLRFAVAVQVVAGVAVMVFWSDLPLAALAAVGFVAYIGWTVAYPTTASLVPRLVDSEALAVAMSLLTTVEAIAWVVGPGVGGLLLSVWGPGPAAGVAGSLGLVGLILASWPAGGALAPKRRHLGSSAGFWAAYMTGVRTVMSSRAILVPLLFLLVSELAYGSGQVLLLLAATETLGMSEGGFGALNASLGVGALGALVIVNRLARSANLAAMIAVSVVVTGVPIALVAGLSSPAPVVPLLVLSGAGLLLTEVLVLTTLQRNVPPDRVARVFGVLDSMLVGAVFVGSAIAAPLSRLVGLTTSLVVVGVLLPALAVLALPALRASRQAHQVDVTALRSEIDLLAALPVLRGASRVSIEVVATHASRESVAAGATVIAQGDAPDDFFAIVHGSFDVLIDRGDGVVDTIHTISTGDGFGELGLLHGTPRGATVVAVTAGEVLRVPGQAFADAVGPGLVSGGSSLVASVRDLWSAG